MALTDIINKIKSDAEAESSRIIKKAEEEAASIQEEAAKKAAEILRVGKEGAEALGKETRDRTMSAASHQAKFTSQGFQASLIDRTFAEVEKRFSELSDVEYHDFVLKRAKPLPEKEGTLTVSKKRKDETLKALKEAGVDTKDAKEGTLLGGFILETKTAEYNNSIREIIRRARERFSGDAARTLVN